MINWLKKNKKFLDLTAIEVELGIGQSTLSKATKDKQPLSQKWYPALRKFREELSKDVE